MHITQQLIASVASCCDTYGCRFNPIDARCAMELDDIKPESWRKLTAATSEYCSQPDIAAQFEKLAELLTADQGTAAGQQNAALQGRGLDSRRSVQQQQQQQWGRHQHHQQIGAAVKDRKLFTGIGSNAGGLVRLGLGSLGGPAGQQQQQEGFSNQVVPGIPLAPSGLTSLKRQRAAAGDVAEQGSDRAQARAVAAAASDSRAGLAAPKLMYQKGVLLVKAPRNVAAAAAAAATAAGTAALGCMRQQQQELVGRMLAATLPQRFLQVCDLSAAAAASGAAAGTSGSRQPPARPQSQQAQAATLAQNEPHGSSPKVGDHCAQAAATAAAQQSQNADGLAQASALTQVNSQPAERRSSYGASSPAAAAAAASPKAPGSWLGYLFPWPGSSGSEQQEAGGGGAGDGRSSDAGEGVAAQDGGGGAAARAAGKGLMALALYAVDIFALCCRKACVLLLVLRHALGI
jgi:hypothetical protein